MNIIHKFKPSNRHWLIKTGRFILNLQTYIYQLEKNTFDAKIYAKRKSDQYFWFISIKFSRPINFKGLQSKMLALLRFFFLTSSTLRFQLICSGITQKAERIGFCVFGFSLFAFFLMNHSLWFCCQQGPATKSEQHFSHVSYALHFSIQFLTASIVLTSGP